MAAARPEVIQGYMADIAASGEGTVRPHWRIPFPAIYYVIPGQENTLPYVGIVDLESYVPNSSDQKKRHRKNPGRYRVPRSGVVQVLISNPEKTGLKLFLVKYDFRDMPSNTHTFLRQRCYSAQGDTSLGSVRYALHLRFLCSKHGRVYLYRDIRVIFTARTPDSSESLRTVTEGPIPHYSPVKSGLVSVVEESPQSEAVDSMRSLTLS